MYYLSILGREMGPFTLEELQELAKQGRLSRQSIIRTGDAQLEASALLRDDCFTEELGDPSLSSDLRRVLCWQGVYFLILYAMHANYLVHGSLGGPLFLVVILVVWTGRQIGHMATQKLNAKEAELLDHCLFVNRLNFGLLLLYAVVICSYFSIKVSQNTPPIDLSLVLYPVAC